jgi:hypothetical protein
LSYKWPQKGRNNLNGDEAHCTNSGASRVLLKITWVVYTIPKRSVIFCYYYKHHHITDSKKKLGPNSGRCHNYTIMPPFKNHKYYWMSVVHYNPKPYESATICRTKQKSWINHKRCFDKPEPKRDHSVNYQIEFVKSMNESPCRPRLLIEVDNILLVFVIFGKLLRFNIHILNSVKISINDMGVVQHNKTCCIRIKCPLSKIVIETKWGSQKVHISPNRKPNG